MEWSSMTTPAIALPFQGQPARLVFGALLVLGPVKKSLTLSSKQRVTSGTVNESTDHFQGNTDDQEASSLDVRCRVRCTHAWVQRETERGHFGNARTDRTMGELWGGIV